MNAAFARKLAGVLLNLCIVVLWSGFAAAALVRYSPGFDVDENAWTPRIGSETLARMHRRDRTDSALPVFYARYLASAARGNFGVSESYRQPVADLLRARAAVSLQLILAGACGGLLLGGLLAWLAVWPSKTAMSAGASSISGLLIAIPPAVLALFFFYREAPLAPAVSLVVAPRVFGTLRELLRDLHGSPALLGARARGLDRWRIALQYVARPAAGQLTAFAGVALVLALGCLIPVEALCDVPGIGQLAWKGALARDLPLLAALTLILTTVVSAVHAAGELAK